MTFPRISIPSKLLRPLLRLIAALAMLTLLPLILLASCQSKLIYFPRPYKTDEARDWRDLSGGRIVEYETSQGKQRAFLQGELVKPRRLWVVCGGNGTVALDWSHWFRDRASAGDAWLLVDYPGYGDCEGKPSPGHIRENLRTVVPLAAKEVGLPIGADGKPDATRLRFFGHSLGAAASLVAASEFGIQRGVLLTPFTSTMDMSKAMTGLPLGFLVWHRFDNSARLAELAKRGPGRVVILHGTDDEAIPVEMGRTLAKEREDVVKFVEIPGGRHNTLQDTNTREVVEAIREAGE
jgi:pimeloyl-ACP methyl ester carboxylesterase